MSKLVDKIKNLIKGNDQSSQEKSVIKKGELDAEFTDLVIEICSLHEYKDEIEAIAPHRHYKVDEIQNLVLDKIRNDKELFMYQDYLGINLGMYACEYKLDEIVKFYINDATVNRQRDSDGATIGTYVMRFDRKQDLIKQVIENKISILERNKNINFKFMSSGGLLTVQEKIFEDVIDKIYPGFDILAYESGVDVYEQYLEQKKTTSLVSTDSIQTDQEIVESENDGQDFE